MGSGIDLHTHTIHSDGTLSPAASVRLAAERGLAAVSVSDHDSTEGLAEAAAAAEEVGVELVPGVEFSAEYEGGSVHVLCYWPDPGHAELQRELRRLRDDRWLRGEGMVRKLQALGHPVTFERVQEIAEGKNIGRPHVAEALVEAGVIPTIKDAFTEELIGTGGRAYVAKHALHPVAAVRLIKRAGGVAVLAHPVLWRDGAPVPQGVIEDMAEAGLDGLEAAHPDHDPLAEAHYRGLAARLGLAVTGSSDCHGSRYRPVRMGSITTEPDQFARLKEIKGL